MKKTGLPVPVFLGAALALLFFLAAVLPGIRLEPGRPVASFTPNRARDLNEYPSVITDGSAFVFALRGLFALAGLGLLGAAAYLFLKKKGRVVLFVSLGLAALLLVLAVVLPKQTERARTPQWAPVPQGAVPPPEKEPTALKAPDWFGWAAASVAAGLVALAGYALTRGLLTRRRAPFRGRDAVLAAAEASLDRLRGGAEAGGEIVRCYREMSRAVWRERGIARREDMTPREFEALLAERGLPEAPLAVLTGLFELVRYGGRTAAPPDTRAAVDSLRAIVDACRAASKPVGGRP
jgi:hypothetical protein